MVEPIRFYTDEHVGRSVASGLRRRGVDVLTVPEADMLGATDFEHLKFATNQGRVLFTQDDDFLRLHAQGLQHSPAQPATPPKPHLSKRRFSRDNGDIRPRDAGWRWLCFVLYWRWREEQQIRTVHRTAP